jgi:hypothetical protein
LKSSPEQLPKVIPELEKDLRRLKIITNRFSQIGSKPDLQRENLADIIQETVDYFKKRLPQKNAKVEIIVELPAEPLYIDLNSDLFSWVLENLIKNGLDALENHGGKIVVQAGLLNERQVFIDVSDTGKGIPKSDRKTIFKPGYSTKKRGWGLGLSLAKRIVEEYHSGKLLLKETHLGKGTTFRIIMNGAANKSE